VDPATAMFRRDRASALLGIELVELGQDRAVTRLEVTAELCNGHGTVHGGVVFLLADTAFGCACNGREEQRTIASADVHFLAPAAAGATLEAEAALRAWQGRSAIYDVTVRSGDTVVAEFRGRSLPLRREVPDLPQEQEPER
jgi:acyl-CoA thioesterase